VSDRETSMEWVDSEAIAGMNLRAGDLGAPAGTCKSETNAMSNESLLAIVAVGLVAGWLAGKVMRGAGYGIVGDLVIGVVGACIGDWLLPRLGIFIGTGVVAAIVDATIGALLLLVVLRFVAGRRRWGGGWGRRRWGWPL
jgi:uncharacterized membrane protein YeaQ/YmgE (transglycosylase-associated protein family)